MRTVIPPITDHTGDLKHRLQREHDGHRKARVQMLYLLVTQQAQDRQDVARLLGVHRNTIGRWLARYAAQGEAQSGPTEPHKKTLRRFQRSRLPVGNASRR
jgi:transposase